MLVSASVHGAVRVQLCPGKTTRATDAQTTEPSEKKTDSAVSQKCFDCGMDSRKSVPSIGMLPPTPVPTPKLITHTRPNVGAKLSAAPSTAVTTSVRRNTYSRPYKSAHEPHTMLPSVMPANSADVARPMVRSAIDHSYWMRGSAMAIPWIHIWGQVMHVRCLLPIPSH